MLVTLWSTAPADHRPTGQARLLELHRAKAISFWTAGLLPSWSSETDVQQEGRRDVDPCTWSIIVTAAAVVVLPLVLLMVTVMLLAVASLVIPARRQRYLLACSTGS